MYLPFSSQFHHFPGLAVSHQQYLLLHKFSSLCTSHRCVEDVWVAGCAILPLHLSLWDYSGLKKITNQLIFTRKHFYCHLKKTSLLLNWHLPNLGCQLTQTNKISRLLPYAALSSLPYPRQGSRLTSAHALWRSKPFWKRSKNESLTASTRSFEQ